MDERYLFRGYDKKSKKMFPVHQIEYSQITGEITRMTGYIEEPDDNGGWKTVYGGDINKKFGKENRYCFMQCTGLRDKNDKLIFEGDIFKQHGSKICVVEWLNDSWNAYYRALILHISDGVEIIGNIYDNPELLKEDTNHANP